MTFPVFRSPTSSISIRVSARNGYSADGLSSQDWSRRCGTARTRRAPDARGEQAETVIALFAKSARSAAAIGPVPGQPRGDTPTSTNAVAEHSQNQSSANATGHNRRYAPEGQLNLSRCARRRPRSQRGIGTGSRIESLKTSWSGGQVLAARPLLLVEQVLPGRLRRLGRLLLRRRGRQGCFLRLITCAPSDGRRAPILHPGHTDGKPDRSRGAPRPGRGRGAWCVERAVTAPSP